MRPTVAFTLFALASCSESGRTEPDGRLDTVASDSHEAVEEGSPPDDMTCSVECFDDGDCGDRSRCDSGKGPGSQIARCEYPDKIYTPPQAVTFDAALLNGACRGDNDCSVRKRCSLGRTMRTCRFKCSTDDECNPYCQDRPDSPEYCDNVCVAGVCLGCSASRRDACPAPAKCVVYDMSVDYGYCIPTCNDTDEDCSGNFCVGPDGQ